MSIFRGPGGAEFDIDVPEDAEAREEFDAWAQANGVVAVNGEPVKDEPKGESDGEPVAPPVKKATAKKVSK